MFGQILNTPLSFIMNNLLDDYICVHNIYGTKYSRMYQVKYVEDSL